MSSSYVPISVRKAGNNVSFDINSTYPVVTRDDLSESFKDTHQIIQIYSNKYDNLDTYYRPNYYNQMSDSTVESKGSKKILFIYGGIMVCFLLLIWTRDITINQKIIASGIGLLLSNPFIISSILPMIMNLLK